jgi:hypothetical protein
MEAAQNTSTAPSFQQRLKVGLSRGYQAWLDKTVPHLLGRWLAFLLVFVLVGVRILLLQGFCIIASALHWLPLPGP